MDALDELKKLVDVAREQTEDSQIEVLWRITDVFLHDPGSYSDQQRNCFGDIMEQLAYDLEQQIREELSHRIASEDSAPRDLVRRLADDHIAVARPVLEQSPALSEDDLVEITERKGKEHRLAVTKRTDITGRLSSVLVTHGDDEIVESLTLNKTAKMTRDTVDRIADQAKKSPSLQTALISRDDVPKPVLIHLLAEVSEKMRGALLDKLGGYGAAALKEAMEAVKASFDETSASSAEREVDILARRGLLNEKAIVRFVQDNKPMEFLVALARLCDMDVVAMENILADATGQTLVIVCRSKGFRLATFKIIAVSRMCAVSSDIVDWYPLTRIYRRFTDEKAERAMRFLQMRGYTAEQEAERTERIGLTG